MHPDYQTRPAQTEDIGQLAEIEIAAANLFRGAGLEGDYLDEATPADVLAEAQADGRLWVAVHQGRCVGFAIADRLASGEAWLEEVDVHPDHGRRGLGRALVENVIAWARREGFPTLSLSTFRDVPWNAPFYAAVGFCEVDIDRCSVEIRRILDDEARRGLPMNRRVVMSLELVSGPGSA